MRNRKCKLYCWQKCAQSAVIVPLPYSPYSSETLVIQFLQTMWIIIFILRFTRIERLWRDVRMCVTGVYYDILHRLEDCGYLEISNFTHLFCCHCFFLPRIQASLNAFRNAWDSHSLRTENNLTPNQLWEVGQYQNPIDNPEVISLTLKCITVYFLVVPLSVDRYTLQFTLW